MTLVEDTTAAPQVGRRCRQPGPLPKWVLDDLAVRAYDAEKRRQARTNDDAGAERGLRAAVRDLQSVPEHDYEAWLGITDETDPAASEAAWQRWVGEGKLSK